MPEQALKEQLQALHQALGDHPQLDEETRNLMHQVVNDIENMEQEEASDIAAGLQEQVIRFDNDYPTLAAVVRQVIDTLGRIGV